VNEAHGEIEKLPFDIRPRNMVRYNLPATANEDERRTKREGLRNHLKGVLELAIKRNETEVAAMEAETKRADEQHRRTHAILVASPDRLHPSEVWQDGMSYKVVEMSLTFQVANNGGVACTLAHVKLNRKGCSRGSCPDASQFQQPRQSQRQPVRAGVRVERLTYALFVCHCVHWLSLQRE